MTCSGRRILVIDDNTDFTLLVDRTLRATGIAVTAAHRAQDALSLMSSERFDAILMDLELPEVDGLELARRFRAQGYQGPILVVSAHALPQYAEGAYGVGCNAYLTKPISIAKLRSEVLRFVP